jgi:Domain of unknown function (DUF6766)
MKRFFLYNSLSLVLLALFLICFLGQILFGLAEYNEERIEYGKPPSGLLDYLGTGHFLEAAAENWESEFLQMGLYVFLTTFLFQRGSAESRNPEAPLEEPPKMTPKMKFLNRHRILKLLYEHSLAIAFLLLFLVSFVLHADGSLSEYNEEQSRFGYPPIGLGQYLTLSRFWFESFQNWQSEFLAILAMVVLSIFLRQKGSPESKRVDATNDETAG